MATLKKKQTKERAQEECDVSITFARQNKKKKTKMCHQKNSLKQSKLNDTEFDSFCMVTSLFQNNSYKFKTLQIFHQE